MFWAHAALGTTMYMACNGRRRCKTVQNKNKQTDKLFVTSLNEGSVSISTEGSCLYCNGGTGMHSASLCTTLIDVNARSCCRHIQRCTCLRSQVCQLLTLFWSHEVVHSKDRWVQMLNVHPRIVQIGGNEVCCKVAKELCVVVEITLSSRYASPSCVLSIDGGQILSMQIWHILTYSGFRVGSVRFGCWLGKRPEVR